MKPLDATVRPLDAFVQKIARQRVVACWSVKGGSGTTVTSVALALHWGSTTPDGALLVDLGGDLPAVLATPPLTTPGILDWLEAGSDSDALDRLAVEVGNGVHLVPQGRGKEPERLERLIEAIAALDSLVFVDCGPPHNRLGLTVAAASAVSPLVMRPCYLALRRAVDSLVRPTGVVVLEEPGHLLRDRDIAETLGVPVVARVPWDPLVARAVDAGTLVKRVPPSLRKALQTVAVP